MMFRIFVSIMHGALVYLFPRAATGTYIEPVTIATTDLFRTDTLTTGWIRHKRSLAYISGTLTLACPLIKFTRREAENRPAFWSTHTVRLILET